MPSSIQPRRKRKDTPRRISEAGPLPLVQSPSSHDEYDDGVDDGDLRWLASSAHELGPGQNSEAIGSRPSSPAQDKIPDSAWYLDPQPSDDKDQMPLTSSPKGDNLPDTAPIPKTQEIDQGVRPVPETRHFVDLSETASTGRRSPSVRESEFQDFPMALSSRATSKRALEDNDEHSLEGDELPPLQTLLAKTARVQQLPAVNRAKSKFDMESKRDFVSSPPKLKPSSGLDLVADNVSEASVERSPRQIQSAATASHVSPISNATARPHLQDNTPLKDINGISANKTSQKNNRRSPDKQSTQERAPDSSSGSGKKRKQQAKKPLDFDSNMQAVQEEPPTKKKSPQVPKKVVGSVKKAAPLSGSPATSARTALGAAKKSAPISNSPAMSVKRPATKAPARPAKKPKTGVTTKQSTSLPMPRKAGNRAAAKAAQAAFKDQVSSSDDDADEGLDFEDHVSQPAIDSSATKLPHAIGEENNHSGSQSKPQKPILVSKVKTENQTTRVVPKLKKVSEHAHRDGGDSPPVKAFVEASGKMYDTSRPKLKDNMVKDSQNDTQDLVKAHLAEEKSVKDHVSISSDQSSDSDEVEIPESLVPMPTLQVNEKHHRDVNEIGVPQKLPNGNIEDEIPDSLATDISPRLQPGRQDPKLGAQQKIHVELRKPVEVPVPPRDTIREALAARVNNTMNGNAITKGKVANEHRKVHHSRAEANSEAARHEDPNARKRTQMDSLPGDAFINDIDSEDRGRPRVRSSGPIRILSVSQTGSPTRLTDSESEEQARAQILANVPSPKSAELKKSLDHHANYQPKGVPRRLSYKAPAPPKIERPEVKPAVPKHPEPSSRASDFEATETTLVDSEGSNGRNHVSARFQNAPQQAEVSKVKNKIYEQMSAVKAPEPPAEKAVEVQQQTSPMKARRIDMATQLHGIIDLVTQRLEQSEESVEQTIVAYEEGTKGCVRRIEQRLVKEHGLLRKQWDTDGKVFTDLVLEATQAIHVATKARSQTATRLERDVSRRRLLYEQTSRSLRAFHQQVMRR